MRSILLLTLHIVFAGVTYAQVKTNFNNTEQIGAKGKFVKNFRGKNPHIIPSRDHKTLFDKEASENANGTARPFKIAEAIKVDIDVVSLADWVEEGDFAYGKYTIVATNAKSISANFDQFYLPQGTELYVYSENGEMITGPITEIENNENNFWGTWVYKGERITVDLKAPIKNKPSLRLHISNLAYGYKNIYKTQVGNFGESAACEINVLCALGNGWENERNSVALILDANSQALCSGALINNACNLNIPYLLTANHCFNTNPQQNVSQWKFTFQAWSTTCDPSQNANGITFNGSTLRANSAGSDFCLVELNQAPAANSGITYAGWSRNAFGIQQTTIIHHPFGDVMKITRDNDAPVVGTFNGANCWHLNVDNGTTEPGSSGAPYFDQNHRIIGQHFGINDPTLPTCNQVSKFGGRFDVSWAGDGTNATRLSNWLDPGNTDAMTVNTNGIPNITGPSLICTTGTYTLNNLPQGATVTWQSSNVNVLTINSSSGVATQVGNGTASILASINGSCGPVSVPSVNVWVGPPVLGLALDGHALPSDHFLQVATGQHTLSIFNYGSSNVTMDVNRVIGGLFPGTRIYSHNYGSQVEIDYGWVIVHAGETYTFTVSSSSACGNQSTGAEITTDGNISDIIIAYPNPAASVMALQVADSVSTSSTLNQPYQINIMNRFSQTVYSVQSSEKNFQIPLENLPNDTYYLNVFYQGAVLQKQIVIKR